ncbi:Nicotinate-nucleotide adenylyltransferase [Toxoplasma gondii TgCatPRC2]|uniref:Nicotinate-nucleotide adenylyltransferase n=3 Tax=Toxoplasma gondii TaxID=5811 RepID=A0A0F7V151_TOXGV|nr:Nicotinate-nucleotide adenylyltransferase [Toxoplasma gondii ME49]EPT27418.1 Nicotinate-nucleotide adenylyltransferase [Toxoplasma gondii ME49]ESS29088.1 Nicotinate-nucleotide adenylyltransferase [Toxoplasma gondii VEG]KYK64602.1 Nicotinate-nucleotide adenylyltransferase [Toxoplasma gondii TgCatPRC2]CEL76235.1 TPA: Probable nicotinate-nucleotide adenylyltransferase [Toxoplasma gondii VEG]|eukprot:XP_018636151.1 Nicotinate-nucleotide adenylyltransferase [Toxoplasma gondii ME49]
MGKRRICYFGGSFDPPTYGHMFSAAAVLDSGCVDEVWMSPCGGDPEPSADASPSICLLRGRESRVISEDSKETLTEPSEEWRQGAAAAERPRDCTSEEKHPGGTKRLPTQRNGWDTTGQASAEATAGAPDSSTKIRKTGELQNACGVTAIKRRPDKAMRTPAALRLHMIQLAVSHFFGPEESRRSPVRVLQWEALTPGFTPTFKVLKRLQEENPDCEFSILIGEDILPDLHKWYNAPALMDEFAFLIIPRNGEAHHMAMLLSSSERPTCRCSAKNVAASDTICACVSTSRIASASSASPQETEFAISSLTTIPACVEERQTPHTTGPSAANVSLETSGHSSLGRDDCERLEMPRCIACVRMAAAEAEQKLRGRIESTLRSLKRVAYIDHLCMQQGRPYFAWTASSSYVRRVLSRRRASSKAVVHCSTLMSPALYSFIDQHGLYVSE